MHSPSHKGETPMCSLPQAPRPKHGAWARGRRHERQERARDGDAQLGCWQNAPSPAPRPCLVLRANRAGAANRQRAAGISASPEFSAIRNLASGEHTSASGQPCTGLWHSTSPMLDPTQGAGCRTRRAECDGLAGNGHLLRYIIPGERNKGRV